MKQTILKKIHRLVKEFYRIPSSKFEPGKTYIGISAPIYDYHEANHLIATLLSGRLSLGPVTKEFEKAFSEYIGTRYGIAVNSGTSANILAIATLLEAGELERGDEVILPAATFSSVASPIIQLGLKPVYVDVDPLTYNLDPNEVRKAISSKTKLLIIVHSLGHPANLSELLRIAKHYKLKIIEDCCEAHGASYKNRKVGSFGGLATFSFYVAHNITTGEGGIVLTNNPRYAKIVRSLREFGRFSEDIAPSNRFSYYDKYLKNYDKKYIFERAGYNVRMTDLAASLGIEQLKKLDYLNQKRRKIVSFFVKYLKKYKDFIQLPEKLPDYFHSYYGFLIVIKKEAPFSRLQLVKYLEKNNIETRPFFAGCLPDQPGFRMVPKRVVGNLPVSRWLRDQAFFIGCHPAIDLDAQKFITKVLQDFLEKHTLKKRFLKNL
ncbi:aminotransferase class I/II-fold pyridoxal phosphate-dependent enzyme [Candidatus Parcubacteria bacterium]|nr:aminotransferase class I/II-fold pyridoxal phosphate-dependent enzyme [Candidatus Parcubacteria bacterium]